MYILQIENGRLKQATSGESSRDYGKNIISRNLNEGRPIFNELAMLNVVFIRVGSLYNILPLSSSMMKSKHFSQSIVY